MARCGCVVRLRRGAHACVRAFASSNAHSSYLGILCLPAFTLQQQAATCEQVHTNTEIIILTLSCCCYRRLAAALRWSLSSKKFTLKDILEILGVANVSEVICPALYPIAKPCHGSRNGPGIGHGFPRPICSLPALGLAHSP